MTPKERQELINDIKEAVIAAAPSTPALSDDELHWVRLAIKRDAQSYALRQAIIEKTILMLITSGIVWVGVVIFEWAKSHGFKP